jgi:hypothetical protein
MSAAVFEPTLALSAVQPRVIESRTIDPVLIGRSLVEAHLLARHAGATAAMVRHSVDEAVAFYREARVRTYLPILIERRASSSLQDSHRVRQDA